MWGGGSTKSQEKSAYVWLLAGLLGVTYAFFGLTAELPGLSRFVEFLLSVDGNLIVLAAFLAIFLEGLYLIGILLPGSSIVLILVVIAGIQNLSLLIASCASVLVGWILAGLTNVLFADRYLASREFGAGEDKLLHPGRSYFFYSWFPAFRAAAEVAEIVGGVPTQEVLLRSLRIKVSASLILTLLLAVMSQEIEPSSLSDRDGFLALLIVGIFCAAMGLKIFYKARQ